MIEREERFREEFVKPVAGKALVIGSKIYPGRLDARRHFSDVIGVDLEPGDGVDYVMDVEAGPPCQSWSFSHIDCCSVLEHSKRPWVLASMIELMLLPGGSLYVHAPTVWRYHGYPDDYWRFTHAGIALLFSSIVWSTMMYSDWKGNLTMPPRIPAKKGGRFGKTQIHAFGFKK